MMEFLQVFYAIFSGIITAAAIPNELLQFGSPVLGICALIPLYMAVARCGSCKKAGLLFSVQAVTVHLLSSFWLGNFHDFAFFTLGAPAITYAIFGFYYGRFFYLTYTDTGTVPGSGVRFKPEEYAGTGRFSAAYRIFFFAAFWTLFEWQKSNGFLGYPWGTLFMTAYKWPVVMQIADITGMWGITFLFALFSSVVGEGLLMLPEAQRYTKQALKPYTVCAAACILLCALSGVYGGYQLLKTRTPHKTLNTVIVQQNSDPWEDGGDRNGILTSQLLTEAALAAPADSPIQAIQDATLPDAGSPLSAHRAAVNAAGADSKAADLVVWGEAVLSRTLPGSLAYYEQNPRERPLLPFIRRTGIPFIIGGPVAENSGEHRFSNSAVFFTADGHFNDSYAKIHLVPFAEEIPYVNHAIVRKLMKSLAGFSYGWTPGTELKLFSLETADGTPVNFTTPICFEDAFPSVCRELYKQGSEVFINITNDAWSKTKSAELQHFVIASFRAIECRTTLVRTTISGFSAVVDPAGRITDSLPLFTPDSKLVQVPVYRRTLTPYVQFGDWFPFVLLVFCVLLIMRTAAGAVETSVFTPERGEKLLALAVHDKKQYLPAVAAAVLVLAWLMPVYLPAYRTTVTVLMILSLGNLVRGIQTRKTEYLAVTTRRIVLVRGTAHLRHEDYMEMPAKITVKPETGRITLYFGKARVSFSRTEQAELLRRTIVQSALR